MNLKAPPCMEELCGAPPWYGGGGEEYNNILWLVKKLQREKQDKKKCGFRV
jgi:hypothetical protein